MTYKQQIQALRPDHNLTTAEAQAFLEAASKAAKLAAFADREIAMLTRQASHADGYISDLNDEIEQLRAELGRLELA